MSKFLKLCRKVEKLIKEQGEDPNAALAAPADPTANIPAGEPVPDQGQVIDPETGSDVQEVSNEKIEELIQAIVNFYQKGQALATDRVNEIKNLPSKINAENSEETVDTLISIFNSSDFPEETDTTES
jgi:hypothetical protein